MASVFVSSLARGEMGAFRKAARDAVDSLGMRPVRVLPSEDDLPSHDDVQAIMRGQ